MADWHGLVSFDGPGGSRIVKGKTFKAVVGKSGDTWMISIELIEPQANVTPARYNFEACPYSGAGADPDEPHVVCPEPTPDCWKNSKHFIAQCHGWHAPRVIIAAAEMVRAADANATPRRRTAIQFIEERRNRGRL